MDTIFDAEQFQIEEAQGKADIGYFDGGPAHQFGYDRAMDGRHPAHLMRASGHCSQDCAVNISIERHLILAYTACGVWVDRWGDKKFVNLRAAKQWASTDEAEAIDQLYHRKRSQVRILTARLADAEGVLENLQTHFGKKAPPDRRYWPEEY